MREVTLRLLQAKIKSLGPAPVAAQESSRFGKPVVVSPRLGQGSFRVLVTDAYRLLVARIGTHDEYSTWKF